MLPACLCGASHTCLSSFHRYVSSDLLRNHPVGNMMRHVLPLHDLSRMDVTVFIILEQQLYNAQQPENKHILGEVQIRNIGRGPPVTRFWDARCSSSCSDTCCQSLL